MVDRGRVAVVLDLGWSEVFIVIGDFAGMACVQQFEVVLDIGGAALYIGLEAIVQLGCAVVIADVRGL